MVPCIYSFSFVLLIGLTHSLAPPLQSFSGGNVLKLASLTQKYQVLHRGSQKLNPERYLSRPVIEHVSLLKRV